MDSLRGKLLVSSPALFDPNFRKTIVLIAHHDDEGALGLVLNRPAEELPVAVAAPQLTAIVDGEEAVHVGGPVSPESLMVLAEFGDPADSAAAIVGDVGFVPADAEPEELDTRRARVYAGYSGWGAGQLEDELEEGSWIVVDAAPDDAFAADPEALWRDVLRREGGKFAILATMPPDPSQN